MKVIPKPFSTTRGCKVLGSSPISASILLALLCAVPGFGQNEDLRVLNRWMNHADAPNAFYRHVSSQAFDLLDKRAAHVAQLQGKQDWLERQAQVRQTLARLVGPFPEKTPLNARITGVVEKEGFRLEKLIYESMPNFFVTAGLFIPDDLKGEAPAILFCSGHSEAAFRRSLYQQTILNLVLKGFVVLAIDPIGQGERVHYYDDEIGESRIGGPTKEHSYPGAQCFISGTSIARYFIWDGIRGIDYLLTRPEVDPERIGCHGLSGGGTQCVYIAAFDERVKAAAPTGYITSFKRLFESIGPQDAEQNFYHGVASGIDHADLLEVRAPKPTLIVATTRDFFSIQGVRETFEEVKKAYDAFGEIENIQLVEDDYTHGYTRQNREAIYGFFQRQLGLEGDPSEKEVDYLNSEETRVTRTGQTVTHAPAETVFSINRKETQVLLDRLAESRQNLASHLHHVKEAASVLSGFIPPEASVKGLVFRGRYQREGYSLERYFMQGEGTYVIPFLLMVPETAGPKPALIYLHPSGKSEEAASGGRMEWFAKRGHLVLAPDLIGTGEMGPGDSARGDSYSFKVGQAAYNLWFASLQIARSPVGIHASDIIRCVRYLESRTDVDEEHISALAVGEMSPALLHAAAFEPVISRIACVEPFISYRSIVMNEYYKPKFVLSAVPGALRAYDLPDLVACLAPRRMHMINVTDQEGHRAGSHALQQEFAIVRSAYAAKQADDSFAIRNKESYESIDRVFSDWIE